MSHNYRWESRKIQIRFQTYYWIFLELVRKSNLEIKKWNLIATLGINDNYRLSVTEINS